MASITEITQYVPEFTNFGQRMYVSAGIPTDTTGVSTGDVCFDQSSGVMYSFKSPVWYPANAIFDTSNVQIITGPGAINVTAPLTLVITTGADAFTLADGTFSGQVKTIAMAGDGGDATITPANLGGYTTITLSAEGEVVQLLWTGENWFILGGNGYVAA